MKLHPNFITEADELELAESIKKALGKLPEKKREGRNRILRMGWDYEKPEKWLGSPPSWIGRALFAPTDVFGFEWNSITLNEYLRGQRIAPHIDSPAFGDVAILSLLADVTMRFTSPVGEMRDFLLPRRSLAVMSGELRHKWKHETLPLESDIRYSIVYRKRLT